MTRVRLLAAVLILAGLASTVSGCLLKDEIFGKGGGSVKGRVSFGFEEAAFRPCGSNDQWWITGSGDTITELQDAVTALGLEWYEPAYAELKGERSARGEYGHLGAYQREFEVSDILDVRLLKEGECPWPKDER